MKPSVEPNMSLPSLSVIPDLFRKSSTSPDLLLKTLMEPFFSLYRTSPLSELSQRLPKSSGLAAKKTSVGRFSMFSRL